MSAADLSSALSAARTALGSRDAAGTAAAVEAALHACSALAARGERLAPSVAAELAATVAACLGLASAERDRLLSILGAAARSRVAVRAYAGSRASGAPGALGP